MNGAKLLKANEMEFFNRLMADFNRLNTEKTR